MKERHKILNEIYRLLNEQSEALKVELNLLKAVQYHNRNQRIRDLLKELESDDSYLPRPA
jgi:hypothetical protein